jgi:hypothetical protein
MYSLFSENFFEKRKSIVIVKMMDAMTPEINGSRKTVLNLS